MKRAGCLIWALGLFVSNGLSISAQQTAPVSLHCLSVVFQPVTTNFHGTIYTLAFGAYESDAYPPSGELRPAFQDSVGDFSQIRGFYKLNRTGEKENLDDISIDLPPFVDANANQIHDFYDISMALGPITTTGLIEDTSRTGGVVTVTWTRPANSKDGLAVAHFQSDGIHLDATFSIPFQIFEYDGWLDYAPGNPAVHGFLEASQAQNPSRALAGPMNFNKDSADLLDVLAGNWTTADGSSIAFAGYSSYTNQLALVQRTGNSYEGLLGFSDGSIVRPAVVKDLAGNPQPIVWDLSIQDPHDANGNGVPDFSDPVLPPPPPNATAPQLAIRLASDHLVLEISGQVGATYLVEQKLTFQQNIWTAASPITLSRASEQLSLPIPRSATTFWRARAP